MTDRKTADSPEYQEGLIIAEVNDGDASKVHNPHIAGTTQWQRWNAGWNDYVSEVKGAK